MKDKKFGKKFSFILIVAAATLVLVILYTPYWSTFGINLSTDKTDWVFFLTYTQSVVGTAALILTIGITIWISQRSERKLSEQIGKQKQVEEIRFSIEKIEQEIDKRVESAFHFSLGQVNTGPLIVTFEELLVIDDARYRGARFYSRELKNVEINLPKVVMEIVRLIDQLVYYLRRNEAVMSSTENELAIFYRVKYESLLSNLTVNRSFLGSLLSNDPEFQVKCKAALEYFFGI